MDTNRLEWFEALIEDRISDAMIVLDRERKIRFANETAAILYGFHEAKDLLGIPYLKAIEHDKVFGENGEPIPPQLYPSQRAFGEGKATRDEIVEWVDRKNEHHWLSISSFPFFGPDEKVEFVAVVFKNISDKKLHEDQLKFLIASSKVLSITTDVHARLKEKAKLLVPAFADWCTINLIDEDGSLIRVAIEHRDPSKNKFLERLAQLAAENPNFSGGIHKAIETRTSEFYPMISIDRISPEKHSEEYVSLEKILTPCSAMIIPIMVEKKIFGVLSLAYSKAESGRVYTRGDLEFMEDFGQHLALVIDNARLYEEITKRDRNRGLFLASLSHELRNPLGPIKNSLELLKIKNNDEDLRDEINIIEHQFDHIAKLLGDLMDINRLTHGKFQVEKQPVELSSIIETAIRTTIPMTQKKKIELSMDISPSPLWIIADPVRIEQALTNLLHNAEKFTPEGGHVRVSLRHENNVAIIEISDDGIGISKEDIKKIFDLYFQGTKKSTTHSSGLGMGLLLVQEIVRLHGGNINAESEGPGRGSTFTIRLPIAEEAKPTNNAAQEVPTGPSESKKILMIDDNRDLADSLAKLLTVVGYETDVSYSAKEGIAAFDRFHPDLALIDLGMPDIDGYSLARILRNDHHITIPLIALSGYGMEEDKKNAHDAGFDHHLTKPVGLNELRSIFKSYL